MGQQTESREVSPFHRMYLYQAHARTHHSSTYSADSTHNSHLQPEIQQWGPPSRRGGPSTVPFWSRLLMQLGGAEEQAGPGWVVCSPL